MTGRGLQGLDSSQGTRARRGYFFVVARGGNPCRVQ